MNERFSEADDVNPALTAFKYVTSLGVIEPMVENLSIK
jgi:hypothetical protein